MTRSEIIKSFQRQINPKGRLTNETMVKESANAIMETLSFAEIKAIAYKNRIDCDELLHRASSFEKIEAKMKKLQTIKNNLNK